MEESPNIIFKNCPEDDKAELSACCMRAGLLEHVYNAVRRCANEKPRHFGFVLDGIQWLTFVVNKGTEKSRFEAAKFLWLKQAVPLAISMLTCWHEMTAEESARIGSPLRTHIEICRFISSMYDFSTPAVPELAVLVHITEAKMHCNRSLTATFHTLSRAVDSNKDNARILGEH
jgi:hypothetical protein